MKKVILLFFLLSSFACSTNQDPLDSNQSATIPEWRSDDFFIGLYQGCAVRVYKERGLIEKYGLIKGDKWPDSPFDEIRSVVKDCECQTEYMYKNYSEAEVRRLLGGYQTSGELIDLQYRISRECMS